MLLVAEMCVPEKNHASCQVGFTQSVSLSSVGAHKLVFFWTKPCWKILQQLLCGVTAANGPSVHGIRLGGSPKPYSQNKLPWYKLVTVLP